MKLFLSACAVCAATTATAAGLATTASHSITSYPKPTKLPPHSWESVGKKVFLHGCKADGLFNASELELASKFAILTVEKGQGLNLPGYADDKMVAIAKQWRQGREDRGLPQVRRH